MANLLLIDGTAIIYRSYFAFIKNPLINSKGENTSAAYGFINSMLRVKREYNPDYLVIAFDGKGPTFRHITFPDYKSTRAKMPDELKESLPRVYELTEAMNIPHIIRDDVEADDIIGTLAKWGESQGMNVNILSGDKDFYQLINDKIHMLKPGRRGEDFIDIGPAEVPDIFGVAADKVIDMLALMGDASDHVPGVPGVGEKTARKLLNEYGSFDEIFKNAHNIKNKRVQQNLIASQEIAALSKDLVTIRTDLELDFDINSFKTTDPNEEVFLPLLRDLEFFGLLKEFSQETKSIIETNYQRITTMEQLSQVLSRAEQQGWFCIDTETSSLDPYTAQLIGISIGLSEGEAYYIALGHSAASFGNFLDENMDLQGTLDLLKPLLENSELTKVGQNLKFDYKILQHYNVNIRGKIFDTMIAAYLLDPGKTQFNMDTLALEILNHRTTTYSELCGKGRKKIPISDAEIEKVVHYAAEDADIPIRLMNLFAPQLEINDLQELYELIELPLSTVLADMELKGVLLNAALFAQLQGELTENLTETTNKIYEIAGEEFNINSTQQLSRILFDKLELPIVKRTATGFSTDQEVLEKLSHQHELPKILLEYRMTSKLLSTYVEALPALINSKTGRLHTSFNQTVAATGRLSSSDPNLQNIPIKHTNKIRQGFIVPDGYGMMAADYSQIELRILAHLSGDPNLCKAFNEGEDIHRSSAAIIFDVDVSDITTQQRYMAKTVNFGVIYGQGSYALAQQLGITFDEAKKFIENYFIKYPSIQEFREDVLRNARKNEFVTTLQGRRRLLPDINSTHGGRRSYSERMAVNTVIQGSAADLIKLAMVKIHNSLNNISKDAAMILQVHDELVFEVPEDQIDQVREFVRDQMENALKLDVPIIVDIGVGKNWSEAH